MISQTVEYALRAVVTIAQQGGRAVTAQEVSEITRVPAPYLSKLMQGLVRAKVVRSRRGPKGGFMLEKSPDELTIWDVVQAVDPLKRIHECPLAITSHAPRLCALHQCLDDALSMVEELFKGATVAEMLADSNSSTPLCEEIQVIAIESNGLTNPPDVP